MLWDRWGGLLPPVAIVGVSLWITGARFLSAEQGAMIGGAFYSAWLMGWALAGKVPGTLKSRKG